MKTRTRLLLLTGSLSLLPLKGITATRYVDLNNAGPASPYLGWTTAARTIQDAIDAASEGDEIVVTNGVYDSGGRVLDGTVTNRVAATNRLIAYSGPNRTAIPIQFGH